ncbi:beta-1,6-N-acetylglucosaminyltransferase [Elizabethkingia meningoseptica]
MIKHAYLVIAHHEFEVLNLLIHALDNPYNDIYIHFDRKTKELPLLKCVDSNLYILDDRIDIRWGHISQIEAEYLLFDFAYKNKEEYSRYHLISGTHFPLKSQAQIRAFFEKYNDKEVLSFIHTDDYEINMKLGRYNFFIKNYKNKSLIPRRISQFLWHLLLKLQYVFGIKKREPKVTIKANNWVSLTPKAVALVIKEKMKILKEFRWSFCGDEYFVPYLLENNTPQYKIKNSEKLLYNEFINGNPRILSDRDYTFLIQSEYLFARKFSKTDLTVVKKILKHIKSY